MACVNHNTREYRALQKASGIPTRILDAYVGSYLEEFNRYPELDELPGVNSQPKLEESLNLSGTDTKYTKVDRILEYTGKQTVEEANAALNEEHKDLEVSVRPIGKTAIVDIEHRPTRFNEVQEESIPIETEVSKEDAKIVLENGLQKLKELYGIKINTINQDEVGNFPDVPYTAEAFIYNGEIYVNTDRASVDAPLHELTHLVFGSLRFTDPNLYFSLIQSVQTEELINRYGRLYPNRTMGDLLEEIYVTEFANYITGQESVFNSFDNATLSKIVYDTQRVIDSMLMGRYSVQSMNPSDIYTKSIKELVPITESTIFNNERETTFSEAEIHRVMANEKSELMKKGELLEQC